MSTYCAHNFGSKGSFLVNSRMETPNAATDEVLWQLASGGDLQAEEQLAERYVRLVRCLARPYFLVGGDSEDLLQEGMIGLLSAIRQYDPERETAFKTFAEACIRNRIYTAIKSALRSKHTPLNGYISIESPQFDESQTRTAGILTDPEDIILARERVSEVLEAAQSSLSAMESKVLGLYLDGCSYEEIARLLNRPEKSVDNAIQRIRRKLT